MYRRGRLGKGMDPDVLNYISSLEFDHYIFESDIMQNIAHVSTLAKSGILSREDALKLIEALREAYKIGYGALPKGEDIEDIHMALERFLIDKLGDLGGMVNVARSRNDQIACDLRLRIREEIVRICELSIELLREIIDLSRRFERAIFPGYTHLQQAQPILFSHLMLAYFDSFVRDIERFLDCLKRVNRSPLGGAALAGTSFEIDREFAASLLGFDGIVENSADAVSSRDFILEFLFCSVCLMIDLSRLAEDLIIWSSRELGYVELGDEVSSTSSIMPHKKNPDALEILRAKCSRLIGSLCAGTSLMKSLPSTYNRDLQELNSIVFSTFEDMKRSLTVMRKVLATITLRERRILGNLDRAIVASEIANLLVRKFGLSFRKAHELVGRAVRLSIEEGEDSLDWRILDRVLREEIGKPLPEDAIKLLEKPELFLDSLKSRGSSNPREVERMLRERENLLDSLSKRIRDFRERFEKVRAKLLESEDFLLSISRGEFDKLVSQE